MAGRRIQPARFPGATPEAVSVTYTTGQTFKRGAMLTFVAAGTVQECGADPATFCGIAAEDAGSKLGYDMANSPTVVTGRVQEVTMYRANRQTIFSMRGVNGGTDPTTPAQTDIDAQYGSLKDADGIWTLDLAETTTKQWEIVDIDIDNKIYFCKALEAALETP